MIVISSAHNGSIEEAILVYDAVLVGKNGDPGISPCFGGLNDLSEVSWWRTDIW